MERLGSRFYSLLDCMKLVGYYAAGWQDNGVGHLSRCLHKAALSTHFHASCHYVLGFYYVVHAYLVHVEIQSFRHV